MITELKHTIALGHDPEALAYVVNPERDIIYIGNKPMPPDEAPDEAVPTIVHENLHQVFKNIPEIYTPNISLPMLSELAIKKVKRGRHVARTKVQQIADEYKAVVKNAPPLTETQKDFVYGRMFHALKPTESQANEIRSAMEHRAIDAVEKALRANRK